jgi:hypothetical protein
MNIPPRSRSWCRWSVRRLELVGTLVVLLTARALWGQSAASGTPPGTNAAPPDIDISSLLVKEAKNQLALSADYFLAEGHIQIPIVEGTPATLRTVVQGPINGNYYGSTLSYSRGPLALDVSYSKANYTGTSENVPAGTFPGFNNSRAVGVGYTRDDDWYQAYVRYFILNKKHFSAFVRGGVTYITSKDGVSISQPEFTYSESDKFDDITGNLGAGVGYTFFRNSRWSLGLGVDGEGFFGERSQTVDVGAFDASVIVKGNSFKEALLGGSDTFDNTIWGGTGRASIQAQLFLGKAQSARVFVDGGMEGIYDSVDYSKFQLGSRNELFWGPYVKAGLRVSF